MWWKLLNYTTNHRNHANPKYLAKTVRLNLTTFPACFKFINSLFNYLLKFWTVPNHNLLPQLLTSVYFLHNTVLSLVSFKTGGKKHVKTHCRYKYRFALCASVKQVAYYIHIGPGSYMIQTKACEGGHQVGTKGYCKASYMLSYPVTHLCGILSQMLYEFWSQGQYCALLHCTVRCFVKS